MESSPQATDAPGVTADYAGATQLPATNPWDEVLNYIRSQETRPPTTNAWAQVSNIIRNADAETIKDCQDDIDSILVFAGLFSAVLTALLVESYGNLQQDPQDTIIFLLQQLVLQTNSFVISDRLINSTVLHPNLTQPFTPSPAAQRVNILWFSSLTLSLMSASFSIIVKQWLREFLTRSPRASPRQHMRIRHFRNPGLSKYMVFQIAAFLPVLLQLSLLLFFLGLCFFTASVHESVGNTTLPFVVTWGFLFVITSLVPVADPKCPYKVPLLRAPTRELRKILRICFGGRNKMVDTVIEKHSLAGGDAHKPIPTRVERAASENDSKSNFSRQCNTTRIATPVNSTVHPTQGVRDYEDDAAYDDTLDVDILVTALEMDAFQTNDQLLKDIMFEASQHNRIPPAKLYHLPARVLEYRMDSMATDALSRNILDMRNLSQQTYSTIMQMFTMIVEEGIKSLSQIIVPASNQFIDFRAPPTFPSWFENSICALLSDSHFDHPDPETVNRVLYSCLTHKGLGYRRISYLIYSRFDGNDVPSFLLPILRKLQGSLHKEKSTKKLTNIVKEILKLFAAPAEGLALPRPLCPDDCREVMNNLFFPRLGMKSYNVDGLDCETLRDIDLILLDDSVLIEQLWRVLSDANLSLEQLSVFLIGVVSNRVGTEKPQQGFLDLSHLPKDTYASLMELAARIVLSRTPFTSVNPSSTASNSPRTLPALTAVVPTGGGTKVDFSSVRIDADKKVDDGLETILSVLLAKENKLDISEPSEAVIQALRHCIRLSDEDRLNTAKLIRSRIPNAFDRAMDPKAAASGVQELSRVLRRMQGSFALIDKTEDLLLFIQTLFPHDPTTSTSSGNRPEPDFNLENLTADNDHTVEFNVPRKHRNALVEFLISNIKLKARTERFTTDHATLFVSLFILSDIPSPPTMPPENMIQFMKQVALMSLWGGSKTSDGKPDDPRPSESPVALSKDVEYLYRIILDTSFCSQEIRFRAQTLFIAMAKLADNSKELGQIITSLYSYVYHMHNAQPELETNTAQQTPLQVAAANIAKCSIQTDPDDGSPSNCALYLRLLAALPLRLRKNDDYAWQRWKQLFDLLTSSLETLARRHHTSRSEKYRRGLVDDCQRSINTIKQSDPTFKLPFVTSVLMTALGNICNT